MNEKIKTELLNKKQTTITFPISNELKKRIESYCLEKAILYREFIRIVMKNYLWKKEEKKSSPKKIKKYDKLNEMFSKLDSRLIDIFFKAYENPVEKLEECMKEKLKTLESPDWYSKHSQ